MVWSTNHHGLRVEAGCAARTAGPVEAAGAVDARAHRALENAARFPQASTRHPINQITHDTLRQRRNENQGRPCRDRINHPQILRRNLKINVYYLTDVGRDDTDKAAESARQLFQPVLARMLQNTAELSENGQGEIVCRRFVSECFARFGQQIAKVVTGAFTRDQLLAAVDVEAAFAAATDSMILSIDATQSLKTRYVRFLRSNERDDQELKFRLTQGYYVAQLLDINTHEFNPIAMMPLVTPFSISTRTFSLEDCYQMVRLAYLTN